VRVERNVGNRIGIGGLDTAAKDTEVFPRELNSRTKTIANKSSNTKSRYTEINTLLFLFPYCGPMNVLSSPFQRLHTRNFRPSFLS